MKSTLDKADGLLRKLKIEVPKESVQAAFEKVYRGLQRSATIKGFRKGKAPLATIRSIYADRVRQDVLNDLISDSYQAALSEHSLEPVGYPQISVEEFIEDGAFVYSAQLEIRPEIQLKKFEGLEVEKEQLVVGDEQIQAVLENIRNSHAQPTPVLEDRGVISGDIVEIDFVGTVDGQALEGGSGEGRLLEIGSGRFIPGFEEGLVGLKVGESRTLNLRFPDPYTRQDLSGKPVTFQVTLKGLKKKYLPELNDELAAKVGEFKTVAELKEAIRKDLTADEERRIRDELRNRVLKALVAANPLQAPQSLVEQQKQVLVADVHERMKQQGMAEDQFKEYQEKWDKDFAQSAEFMVRSTFLVDALADKLGLRAKPSDIENKIDEYARQTGIEREKVASFYNQSERRSRLLFQITEERVVNHLIEKAKIKEVPREKLSEG